jgi:hypothetical protein
MSTDRSRMKGLLCRNVILGVFFSEQLCNVVNCGIVGGAYIPPLRFWMLIQKYVSNAEVIQVNHTLMGKLRENKER